MYNLYHLIKTNASNDLSLLAKETLHEIPTQFMYDIDAPDIKPLSTTKPKYNSGAYKAGDSKEDAEESDA